MTKLKYPLESPMFLCLQVSEVKKTLAPVGTTLATADHDMHHKGSLTPSVSLRCKIPDDVNQSFYRGNVTTIINDSVFQPSNPMRHAAAMVRDVKSLNKIPPILLKYSDGGTDHRTTLESVKCAAICIFKELNLDMNVAVRCSPGNSWINPCERAMSILNIGLQNCTLARDECREETEKALTSCNSIDDIRKAGKSPNTIQGEWTASLKPVQELIGKRFQRLALKEEPIQVMSPIQDHEIDYLTRHLNYLFPDLDLSKLVKTHTKKIESYQAWLQQHCRQRQYSFQIKKCNDRDCCSAMSTNCDCLPDPMLDESGDHYKQFEEVYGSDTSEKDRPTLKLAETPTDKDQGRRVPKPTGSKTKKPETLLYILDDHLLQGEAAVYTAQNARSTIQCQECNKTRVIYSKLKFSQRQECQLAILLSEYDYSCGAPLTPPGHPLHGKAPIRLNMDCQSPIETPFYSASLGVRDLCYYCGGKGEVDTKLKDQYRIVLPICILCKEKGLAAACFRPYGKKAAKD